MLVIPVIGLAQVLTRLGSLISWWIPGHGRPRKRGKSRRPSLPACEHRLLLVGCSLVADLAVGYQGHLPNRAASRRAPSVSNSIATTTARHLSVHRAAGFVSSPT